MDSWIKKLETPWIREEKIPFQIGDTIELHFKVREGKRERIQVFEGIVISIRGSGLGKTFMVRKISANIGVERIFPFHSPKIAQIIVKKRGKVRRAKLYYLRKRVGRSAQVKSLGYAQKQKEKKETPKLSV